MVKLTLEMVKNSCKEHNLYMTPELNDKLFLHFKGITKIENLEQYTEVQALWLGGNGICEIENLEPLTKLKCLYLQQNCIGKIEGLDSLSELCTLDLSHNSISQIENLANCCNLSSLILANNKIKNADHLHHLSDLKSLSVLDVQNNEIDDEGIVDVLSTMPSLKVLYLKGNPIAGKMKNYRKSLISRIQTLTYLDDRPVFEDERRCVMKWAEGGVKAEQEERTRIREEKAQKHKANMKAFREMQQRARLRISTVV